MAQLSGSDGAPSPTGRIFDMQRFSVHDGPGIRSTVFFKGCPLRCLWCQNPESIKGGPELAFYGSHCHDCRLCFAACSRGATGAFEGRVDRSACQACGDCARACPHGALRLIGRSVSVETLMEEILRDLPFYRSSGGGVTFSGGEPTMQMDFLLALAEACKEREISVGLETCGAFPWQKLAPHLTLFDFVFFDLKVMDEEAHRQATGTGNRRILENARMLVEASTTVTFRAPIIPGQTDGEANLLALARFLLELGQPSLQVLTYHKMGASKAAALGRSTPSLGADGAPISEVVARSLRRLRSFGVEAYR